MTQLDFRRRSRTKNSDSSSWCCEDSNSTQKPPTPCDSTTLPGRPVTSLGHQEGRRVFWGAQISWIISNIFKLYPTHFSRGAKNILGEASPLLHPLVTGLLPGMMGGGFNTIGKRDYNSEQRRIQHTVSAQHHKHAFPTLTKFCSLLGSMQVKLARCRQEEAWVLKFDRCRIFHAQEKIPPLSRFRAGCLQLLLRRICHKMKHINSAWPTSGEHFEVANDD